MLTNNHGEVWQRCLCIIRDNISAISYKTWFEPIVATKLAANILTIQVPSPFFYEYLEEQYIDLLRKTLRKELGEDAKLEYQIEMESKTSDKTKPFTVRYPTQLQSALVNKPVNMPIENQGVRITNPFIIPGLKKVNIDPMLNTSYSFDSYVAGSCNKLAYAAGLNVAQNPGGTAFNPLFIYSETGLGKTHLVQAIGIDIKEKFPDKTVLYVAASSFTSQYTESVRANKANAFLHFCQMIDVLILDDIHEFSSKSKTQQTFFHIFNYLHQSGKQIIITSDTPLVELKGFEERLLSRFKWGLNAELSPPDYDTRINILRKKIYNDGMVVSDDIIEFIAKNVTKNIRELEGALVSLLAHSTLNNQEINIDLARQMLEKIVKHRHKEVSVNTITKSICEYYKIPMESLQSKTRKREIVQARQVAMYFSKSLTKNSLASIGAQIGGKDHATVLHAVKTVNNLIDTDKHFKAQVNDIEKQLKY